MVLRPAWRAIAVAATLALTAAGCGSNSNTSTSDAGPVTVELALVAGGDTQTAYDRQVQRFNDSQDGITLKLRTYPSGDAYNQALTGQVAGGAAPDIFLLDTGSQTRKFADADAVAPLDDLIKNAGVDMSAYDQSLVSGSTVNGKLYAVPKDYSTTALFYRKSLLQAAGVQPPTTWDELRAAAKKLTTDGRYGLGMYAQINYFMAWVQAAGGNFVTDTGLSKVDNPGHVRAVDFLMQLFNTDKSTATPQMTGAGWDGEMLAKKQAAMVFGGTWIPGGVPQAEQDDVGVVAFPPDKQPGSVLYASGWAISSKSSHKDAAAKVIAFLTSDEELLTGNADGIDLIPPKESTRKALLADKSDQVLQVAQQSARGGVPFGLLTKEQVDKYNAMLASLIAKPGQTTPADAIASLAKQLG